jgi:D-sedoheptulose 7-phosphate isomerase
MDKGIDDLIRKRINEHGRIVNKLLYDEGYMLNLQHITDMIVESYSNGGKLLLCGNGGSAADAQHLAAELVSRFYKERKALSAESLNANTSIITAIGNDYAYDRIFARGVEAQGKEGDVLIGISTSGKSKNIVEALKMAKNLGMRTVLFTGMLNETAEILNYTDCLLSIPSKDTPRIQEMHILSGHIMCELIENKMFEREEI